MSDVRKFLKRAAAWLPLAALLIGVNAFVDPAHLFDGGRTERAIAQVLLSGARVTGAANVDERGLQQEIARAARPGATLVLGSSRVMTLDSRMLGRDVRNAAVSGASLCDVMALYELYHERETQPPTVLVGVDPWLLNASGGDARWVRLAPVCDRIRARLALPATDRRVATRATLKRWGTLFSLDYFQSGLRALLIHRGRVAAFAETPRDSNPELTRRPDGSIVYGDELRSLSSAAVDQSAAAYANSDPVYQLGGFARLDPMDSTMLDRFVERMVHDGSQVILFLPPYHPIVHRVFVGDPRYAMVARVEVLVRAIGRRTGARVCGSYDPAAIDMASRDFLDGMHARPEALGRVMRTCGFGLGARLPRQALDR